MSPNPVKTNRSIVNLLWQQNIRTPKEISSKTSIPLRTCQRYVSLLKKSGKLRKIHKSGRPRKLTSEKRRQLGMIIKSNHYTTTTEIKAILEEKYQTFNLSDRTIRRELSHLGYISIIPRKVPLLTQQAKTNRLLWARDHERYNWKKVVFSDETTLQMFRNTMLAWSREKKPAQPMVKHPFKVHVWGATNFKGKVGLYVFTENLDRHLYRQILNEQLYDNADVLVGGQWIFRQDNDPKHTSRDVQNDLNTRLLRRVLAWPSYSPDLNPIENIWAVLKHNVEKHVKKMIAQKKKYLKTILLVLLGRNGRESIKK